MESGISKISSFRVYVPSSIKCKQTYGSLSSQHRAIGGYYYFFWSGVAGGGGGGGVGEGVHTILITKFLDRTLYSVRVGKYA